MENTKINKRLSFRKKTVLALVAVMALATTAFAAGKISSYMGHTTNKPIYTELPMAQEVQKDFGFSPKLVDKFENGYSFENAYTNNVEAFDESGNSIVKAKKLDIDYTNGSDNISLNINDKHLNQDLDTYDAVLNYSDVDIYYTTETYKFVPADYEMTEQDKADKASGKYVFSYGSDKVELSKTQSLYWAEDGLGYSFTAMDSPLSQDDLIEMAHQVIDAK